MKGTYEVVSVLTLDHVIDSYPTAVRGLVDILRSRGTHKGESSRALLESFLVDNTFFIAARGDHTNLAVGNLAENNGVMMFDHEHEAWLDN